MIYQIIQIVSTITILVAFPFVIKSLFFKNKISVNDFSNMKCTTQPKLGILFYYFHILNIPDDFYNKCYDELYNLNKKNPPLGEELYAFTFEKYTGYSPFMFRGWGYIIIIFIIITLILLFSNCI